MDDLRLDARAYDPAYAQSIMREARRMRAEVLTDMAKALVDGRLLARLTGDRKPASNDQRHDMPHGAAPQG